MSFHVHVSLFHDLYFGQLDCSFHTSLGRRSFHFEYRALYWWKPSWQSYVQVYCVRQTRERYFRQILHEPAMYFNVSSIPQNMSRRTFYYDRPMQCTLV